MASTFENFLRPFRTYRNNWLFFGRPWTRLDRLEANQQNLRNRGPGCSRERCDYGERCDCGERRRDRNRHRECERNVEFEDHSNSEFDARSCPRWRDRDLDGWIIKSVKLETTTFDDRMDPKVFLYWLSDMDQYFGWYDMLEERKV